MSAITTSPIEFATNSKSNWFVVSYEWNQCQQILEQAHKLGVIPSPPRKYTHPNVRWIIYFNSGVNDNFMKWLRSTFSVQNVQRVVGAMRSEAALKHENKVYCQRSTISHFKLSEVKQAMLSTIGTAAEIRELFESYNIKVVGVAGLPQCLQLIEELDKFDDVIAELLHKPKSQPEIGTEPEPKPQPKPEPEPDLGAELGQLFKKVDDIMSKPIYQDTVEPEVIEDPFDIPFECEVDIDSPEFSAFVLAAVHQMTLALPPAQAPVDFQPWTSAELSAYTVKEIRKLASLDGIDLTGTSKMKKSDLIKYILPALNAAALAAHLA